MTFIAVQHAKKVVSDSPRLVDFEVGLVNSVFAFKLKVAQTVSSTYILMGCYNSSFFT